MNKNAIFLTGGSPSSPAPPLPERTPESFIMAGNEGSNTWSCTECPTELTL